jgi:parallel beta-helix repeat protein
MSAILALPVQAQDSSFEIAQASQNSTVLHVNAQTGNDTGSGTDRAPFRTLTQALRQAPPNSLLKLAPGTYSQQSGEVFPLELKPGIIVQGDMSDRGQGIIIQGSGLFLSKTSARQQVTLIGSDRATLQGVTVSNPNPQGYGLWIESSSPVIRDSTFTGSGHDGVSIVGNSAPILSNNYFYSNGANGITIYGTSRPELKENIFEKTGFGINVAQNAAPRLIGNRVTQNKDGIVVQGNATPVLRSNVIDGNDRDGLVAIGDSRPDLGLTSDQGNNTFLNNGGLDVNATASRQVIPAAGNQLVRTSGRLDMNATAIAAIPQAAPIRPAARDILAISPSVAIAVPTANPIATDPTTFVQSLPPETVVGSGSLQELTFSRPDVPAVRVPAVRVPAVRVPAVRVPSVTAIPVPSMSVPARQMNSVAPVPAIVSSMPPDSAIPMMASVPIAIQAGSGGGRSLPTPKQATIKTPKTPIPTLMTFNNLVLPTNSTPARVIDPAPAIPTSPLLPVPGSSIPVGNIGEMSSVAVWRKSGRQPTQAANPTPQVAATLHYRVVVDLSDAEALRSIVPGAFTTVSSGRQVLQAGAFGDAGKANQLLQRLTSQGIRASLEQF